MKTCVIDCGVPDPAHSAPTAVSSGWSGVARSRYDPWIGGSSPRPPGVNAMKLIAPISALLIPVLLVGLVGAQCGTNIPGVPGGTSETPRIFGNGSAGPRVIDVSQD